MRLEQMEYLLAVTQYGSMSIASEKLHVAQQTLSIALKKLELELNLQLLNRTSKGVTLTKAGEYIYPHALEMLNQAQEIKDYATFCTSSEKISQLSGNLSIAATQATLQNFIGKSISQICKMHPGVSISCQGFSHNELLRQLTSQKYEIGFMNIGQAFYESHYAQFFAEKFNTEVITSGKLSVLIGRHSPLLAQNTVSIKSIANKYTIACACEDHLDFLDLGNFLSRKGRTEKVLECSAINIVFDNVIENNCVAFSSCNAWHLFEYIHKNELIQVPLRDNIPVLTIAITRKNEQLSPQAEKYLEVLKNIVSPLAVTLN